MIELCYCSNCSLMSVVTLIYEDMDPARLRPQSFVFCSSFLQIVYHHVLVLNHGEFHRCLYSALATMNSHI